MRKLHHGLSILFFLAASATGIACGSSSADICAHLASAGASLETKAQPCGISETSPSESVCEANLASCSASDQSTITAALNCIDGLPTCSTSTEQAFGQALEACGNMLSTLSASCQAAVGQGSSSGPDAGP